MRIFHRNTLSVLLLNRLIILNHNPVSSTHLGSVEGIISSLEECFIPVGSSMRRNTARDRKLQTHDIETATALLNGLADFFRKDPCVMDIAVSQDRNKLFASVTSGKVALA